MKPLLVKRMMTAQQAAHSWRLPLVPASTRNARFYSKRGDIRHDILKSLQNAKVPVTRNWIAKECNRGRSTVYREIESLVKQCIVTKSAKIIRGRRTYLYQLTNQRASQIIQRADGVYAQYCSCGAYVRYSRQRRIKETIYLFWCTKCGKREFVEHPMEGR